MSSRENYLSQDQVPSRQGLSSESGSVPQGYAPQQQHHGQAPQAQQRQHNYSLQPHQQHQQNQYQQPLQQYPHHQHHQQLQHEKPPPPPPRAPQQQPQQQYKDQTYGPRSSDAAAPALPPRPTGSTNRLMVQSKLSFPPPPRSPNKPPKLPPRPDQPNQSNHHGDKSYYKPYGQFATHGPTQPTPHLSQQAGYPTTAIHTQNLTQTWDSYEHTHVSSPPPAPPSASFVAQHGFYPPPPPGPPPLAQSFPPIATVSSTQTFTQHGNRSNGGHASPPPPYTTISAVAPAEGNAQDLHEHATVQGQPLPAPKAALYPGTSPAYTYGETSPKRSEMTPVPLPHSAPRTNAPTIDITTADEACGARNDNNHLQSMIERLNLRQETHIESTPLAVELSGESSTPSLSPAADKLETHMPESVYGSSSTQLSCSGPRPAYVSDVPDEEPCIPVTLPQVSDTATPPAPVTPNPQHPPPPNQNNKHREFKEPGHPVPLLEEQHIPQNQFTAPCAKPPLPQPVLGVHQNAVQASQVPSPNIRPPSAISRDSNSPSCSSTAHPPFQPVTHCIDTPVTFPTWWYTHDSAPGNYICSKCYMDNIYPTVFRNYFCGRYITDGAERRCRFNVPRIIDQLLPDAVSRGTLDTLVLFMGQRMQVKDCKGVDGALGSEGVKWFAVKNQQLPGFVTCEACYQDIVCMSQFAFNFEESMSQAKTDTWACDICVPFIRKEFELRTKNDDWPSFINEAKARMGMPACPRNTPIAFNIRKWFVPIKGQGPPDAVLCVACYCDHILKSGQEMMWEQERQDTLRATKSTNTCMAGMFHLRTALSAADENKEWPLFWSVLNRIAYQEKPCIGDGIVNGNWYTLPSQPEGYNVCGACHAGIVRSLHLENFFVARTSNGPAPNEAHLCAFNVKTQRFAPYLRLMLQTWFTADCTAWDAYTSRCAAVPTCPRNVDFKNRAWYGWPECVICADCYMEFVHGTTLDTPQTMSFYNPVIVETPHICEMYSPRMRRLYQEACQRFPPSPAELFSEVERRRLVYWQTIPQCRQILAEEKFLANKISMARMSSVFYNAAGGIAAIGRNHHYTYGAAGVGYGYENALQLTGAQYNSQANAMSAELGGSKIMLVGRLEQQWLAVE